MDRLQRRNTVCRYKTIHQYQSRPQLWHGVTPYCTTELWYWNLARRLMNKSYFEDEFIQNLKMNLNWNVKYPKWNWLTSTYKLTLVQHKSLLEIQKTWAWASKLHVESPSVHCNDLLNSAGVLQLPVFNTLLIINHNLNIICMTLSFPRCLLVVSNYMIAA